MKRIRPRPKMAAHPASHVVSTYLFAFLLLLGIPLCATRPALWARGIDTSSHPSPSMGIRAQVESPSPIVQRVEPPNWWVGLKPDPMLLITGRDLEDTVVSVDYPGVRILHQRAQPEGHYVFVWLQIDRHTNPGIVPIRLVNGAKREAVYQFPLLSQRPQAGNFQGLNSSDVIYLIMPDRFADGDLSNDHPPDMPGTYDPSKPRAYHGGDLRGIEDHLDYFKELGVTTLWLTPIYQNDEASPQDYHGYGSVDFYSVNEHFGTLKDLQELVAAAHAKGLKIFLDMVPNHTGPRHPWVKDPPETDWFHGTPANHLTASGPFVNLTDPHAPSALWRDLVEGWFAGVLPDLNQENPDVAQYLVENGVWWAEETGVDAYRLDTFPYVSRQFWSEWNGTLREDFPRFSTIGEVFNPRPDVVAFFAGGRKQFDGIDSGVTTVFDYPMYFALRDVLLNGASLEEIVGVLQHDWLYPRPELLVPFLGNHDVPRFSSAPRSSRQKLELGFSLLLTLRGIPELYYGDEIGMPGGSDPDNRRDFPGGFPGDPRNAFTSAGRTPQEEEIFTHVQRLLRLRRENSALAGGRLWHIQWDSTFYAFARVARNERVLVVFNDADAPRTVRLNFKDTPLAGARHLEPLLGGTAESVAQDQVELTVPAAHVSIYEVE